MLAVLQAHIPLTWPSITSEISSGATDAFTTASLITWLPSSCAFKLDKAPFKEPKKKGI